MSWRTVVVTKTSKLDYNLGFMVVRDAENTMKVHIGELSLLIIESTSVSLTAALLNELVKAKVKVIFCDEKHDPSFEIMPYYGSHDCSLKLKRQISWTREAKAVVWTEIVAEKIRNQARLLAACGSKQADMLLGYIEEMELNDASNREGHAAKVYFNALFGMDFKRTDENALNAALNYGYSLILSVFNREVVSSGYLTQLGIFHDNMFNKYNLSCDVMEPLRPLVDSLVKRMEPKKFDKAEKSALLELLSTQVEVDGRNCVLLNGIKQYTDSVMNALTEGDKSLIKFICYEL